MSDLRWLIKSLTFNDGNSIPVNPGDIVVFVGPNNSGKSQSLKDIYELSAETSKGVVILDIETEKIPTTNFEKWLASYAKFNRTDTAGNVYHIFGSEFYTGWYDQFINFNSLRSQFRSLLFSYLRTEARLNLVSPPPLLNTNEPPTHPIQIVKGDGDKRKLLSDYFQKSFGAELFPSIDTREISLILGKIPKFENQDKLNAIELSEKIKQYQDSLPRLEVQGDGMRSFTGILLNLLMSNYSIFFIDEPETFLHPPQAKIIGEIIPEMIPMDKQAFISTHSQDLLKGLIEKCPSRIKIIRIAREDKTNHVKLLDNAELNEVWKDSFMKYSNIIDSLFHESVVLCESDSDCKIYSIVLDEIKKENNQTNNILFTYCGGKRRIPIVAKMLKTLGVDFRIIPDLDFLNDKGLVKSVYEICNGEWAKIEPRYNDVKSGVESLDKRYTIGDLKAEYQTFIDKMGGLETQEISKSEFDRFKKSLKYPKGWDQVKHTGVSAIPNGQARASFKIIDDAFKAHSIFMPHVGELEKFFPTLGGHGPQWADAVLEQYASMTAEDKKPIKAFIASLNL